MARKSRKPTVGITRAELERPVYLTALYARLSIKDNGTDGKSIENQIHIIQQFMKENPELQIAGQYIDNGRTGTNFDRPGFTAMMEDVRNGKINCIVVKDLSRFGRNYLETGNYIEKIFPYLGIRFISVSDHFDSLHAGTDTLLVPLKSILHDTYAKDISKKVSSAIDIKKRTGNYMGKIPPYGYVRDRNDSRKLVIHPERAEIVRQIFRWRMEGNGSVAIAHRLNDMEVPTQFQIRFMEGHADGKPDALWYGSAVSEILKNPYYLGCVVERKSSNLLHSGKINKNIPESEWNLIENTHEPIMDKETFYMVQEMMRESLQRKKQQSKENSHRQRTENILRGIVKCGICGKGIHRDSGYFKNDGTLVHYSFLCSGKYLKTGACKSKAVLEADLLECVFQACKKQLDLLVDMERVTADFPVRVCRDSYHERLNLEACNINYEQKKTRKRNRFYADYEEGLSREQSEDREVLVTNVDRLRRLTQLRSADSLTKEMCDVMVKKVVIYENTVCVHFSFASEYK